MGELWHIFAGGRCWLPVGIVGWRVAQVTPAVRAIEVFLIGVMGVHEFAYFDCCDILGGIR